ncbi:MAG: Ca2+-dependent phosphoinositide-specific phospholipase C [Chitinophagales bacterium]
MFSTTNIITPDDVRGNYATLNEAVLAGNWPTIGESRGKVMFLFDKTNIRNTYIQGHPNLEDRVIFTNSYENESDAAFIKINNPLTNLNRIKDLSDKGYLIRTRADEGTWQARNNDYSNWNTALESGAHLISTDYYKADDRAGDGTWSGYYVGFNNGLYQINPQTTD